MDTLFTLKLETSVTNQKIIVLNNGSSVDSRSSRIIIDESLEL